MTLTVLIAPERNRLTACVLQNGRLGADLLKGTGITDIPQAKSTVEYKLHEKLHCEPVIEWQIDPLAHGQTDIERLGLDRK